MAKKSKTQKAKAAAARAAKKQAKVDAEKQAANAPIVEEKQEEVKGFKKVFKKKEQPKKEKTAAELRQERRDKKMAEKENRAPKKHNRFVQFVIDVKAELKRVTWPTRKEVKQWTGVVVAALVFFGVYVALLDNWIVTPLLLFISSFAG